MGLTSHQTRSYDCHKPLEDARERAFDPAIHPGGQARGWQQGFEALHTSY